MNSLQAAIEAGQEVIKQREVEKAQRLEDAKNKFKDSVTRWFTETVFELVKEATIEGKTQFILPKYGKRVTLPASDERRKTRDRCLGVIIGDQPYLNVQFAKIGIRLLRAHDDSAPITASWAVANESR